MIKFRVLTFFLADNLRKEPKIGKNKYLYAQHFEALILKYQTLDKKMSINISSTGGAHKFLIE